MAEACWYVVHTYSGYENKVKANIEKTIENRHLEDQILEVRVPLQDVVEVKNGAKKIVQKKMFPGYVLLNMVMNDDTWYVVRNTRGVTGFVGPGSKPVPLTDQEMFNLGIQADNISVEFAEGDMVTVISGVWKDTVGVIQSINESKQIVTQVGEALSFAREQYATDSVMETLFRMAVTAAKKVKTEVELSKPCASFIADMDRLRSNAVQCLCLFPDRRCSVPVLPGCSV